MFFDGDLQSGVELALKDSKFVACFVRGADHESKIWEDEFLQDDQAIIVKAIVRDSMLMYNSQIFTALAANTICLRIDADSQEAEFLSAYYPIPVKPTMMVIRSGQLLLDLRAGITKQQFRASILQLLVGGPTEESMESLSPEDVITNAGATSVLSPADQPIMGPTSPNQNTASTASASSAGRSMNPSTNTQPPRISSTVQDLLAEGRQRLEVDKREKDAAEKAERRAEAEVRREATDIAPDSAKAKQASYAQQQRKRQQDVKLERDRILRVIENDKTERREKEKRRKAVAKAEAEGNDGAGGLIDQQLRCEVAGLRSINSKQCAVNIRLLDGSTIRSSFPSDQTLRTNVRDWIDKQRSDGDTPYTFKQILTPMPNRTITISDEEATLQFLGLIPSATLVMVPVQEYSAAYVADVGIVSKGVAAGYNAVSAGASAITRALGTFLGVGQIPPRETERDTQEQRRGASAARASGTGAEINVRTIHDQCDDRGDHHFYNGNQLNFEPRRDQNDEVD